MAHTVDFSVAAAALTSRRLRRAKRDPVDKLNEIRARSPLDAAALDAIMDLVLTRLDTDDQPRRH